MRANRQVKRALFAPWGNGNGHVMRAIALAEHAKRREWHTAVTTMSAEQSALVRGRGLAALQYEDWSTTLDPWRAWTSADFWLTAIGNDRLLLRQFEPDVIISDSRLSMHVAALLEGSLITALVQDMDFPGYTYPGRAREPLWDEMQSALGQALAAHGIAHDFNDPRYLLMTAGVVVPGTPEFDHLPENLARTPSFIGPLTGHSARQLGTRSMVPPAGILFYKTLTTRSDIPAFQDAFSDLMPQIYIATGDSGETTALRESLQSSGAHIADMWSVAPDPSRAPAVAVIHGGHGTILHMAAAGVPTLVVPDLSPERYANAIKAGALESMVSLAEHVDESMLTWEAQPGGDSAVSFALLRSALDTFDRAAVRPAAAALAQTFERFSIEAAWDTVVREARIPRLGGPASGSADDNI